MDTLFSDDVMRRMPPSNVAAEQALLGALLSNNKVYNRIAEILLPEHFADPIHARIYDVASKIIEAGGLADAVTLRSRFDEQGTLEEVGGTKYLTQLLSATIGIVNAPDYAAAIKDSWLRRQIIDIGSEGVTRAYTSDPDATGADLLDDISGRLGELAIHGRSGSGSSLSAVVSAARKEGEDAANGVVKSVSCGIPSLDRCILRLRSKRLYVIGGRPGMGKTALAKSMALNVSLGGRWTTNGEYHDDQSAAWGVGISAMEEGGTDFGASALAYLSGVAANDITCGAYTRSNEMASAVVAAEKRLLKAGDMLEVFDQPGQSFRTIRHQALALQRKMKGKLRLYVVDYLQLMQYPAGIRDTRIAVSENIRKLKNLALEMDIAVIVTSQLKREVNNRTDRRPQMSDLMESGEIEAAADVIMFPYREAYYHLESKPKAGPGEDPVSLKARMIEWQAEHDRLEWQSEINCPKVKPGRGGVFCNPTFNPPRTRFEENAAA